jgi:uncharacterized protein YndB with AHSA1/START domain
MKNRWLRWLAYLAGALLLLVSAVFLIGLSRPELVVANCEIEIRKPVPYVFELVANPKKTKDWYAEVDSVEILSEQPLRYRMTAAGVSGDMETTLLEPNQRVVTKTLTHSMGVSGEWDTRFAASREGTKITHTARMNFSNPFLRFMTTFMDANQEEMKTLEALKKYAESH